MRKLLQEPVSVRGTLRGPTQFSRTSVIGTGLRFHELRHTAITELAERECQTVC